MAAQSKKCELGYSNDHIRSYDEEKFDTIISQFRSEV